MPISPKQRSLAQEIGWLKPKGASARLRAQATLVNGRPTRIDSIALKARDMDATATVLYSILQVRPDPECSGR